MCERANCTAYCRLNELTAFKQRGVFVVRIPSYIRVHDHAWTVIHVLPLPIWGHVNDLTYSHKNVNTCSQACAVHIVLRFV